MEAVLKTQNEVYLKIEEKRVEIRTFQPFFAVNKPLLKHCKEDILTVSQLEL